MSPRPGSAPQARFFATAAKGTESLLESELRELGSSPVRAASGGVFFGQTPTDAFVACLWSRIALRVLEPLASFPCRDGDELYAGVSAVDWSRYLDGERTLAIRATGQNERLAHTHFIAVRAKDAIVDQLRARRGSRPSVDRDDPDVSLFVRVRGESASVSLDYSGASLHARGYRAEEGAAPLRETLAAALVRFSGWDGRSPLIDPLCGSGMLLIEAGLWAARRAPGLARERFGFERWSSFDDSARREIERLRGQARASERPPPTLLGSDVDPRALEQCRANAARAGLVVSLERRALAEVAPSQAVGALVANPPYGERLARPEHLARDLDGLLERFARSRRALIVPRGFPSGLRASQVLEVYNGPIECELRRHDPTGPDSRRGPMRGEDAARMPASGVPAGARADVRAAPARRGAPASGAPPGSRLSFRPKKDPGTPQRG